MSPELLVEALGLKGVPRAGWVRRGVAQPESVAGHSWGVAWLVLALLPPDLDRGRALAYAVLHDLAEVRVGDITPADGVSAADKRRREARAITELFADHPALAATWRDYEAQRTPEARFVRQLDRLDMALQALRYARAGHPGMREFLDSADAQIDHPELVRFTRWIRAHWPATDG